MTSPLAITSTLPQLYVGVPIQQQFEATGGAPPYSDWFIGEIIPNSQWEVMSPDGTFSGVPVCIESGQIAIGLYDSALPTPNYAQVILPFSVVNPPVAIPDYTGLITSEHNQKPDFVALVNLLANSAGAVTAAMLGFPADYDLASAQGAQLDVLGRWIGASRTVFGVLSQKFFGFSDTLSALSFGELGDPSIGGPFLELGQATTSSSALPDAAYRLVLQAKIIANQFRGTLAELEQALTDLAGVPFQIVDPGNLTVAILILQPVSPTVQQLLTGFDFVPRAASVNYEFLFPLSAYTWGLQGSAQATGSSADKNGGVPAWDSAAFINGTYQQVGLSWTVTASNSQLAGGLAANTLAGPSYTALNYGIEQTLAGGVNIYESGALVGAFGTYATGDTFQVVSDGNYVNYLHNNAIIRTVAATGDPFNPMICFYSPNAAVSNVTVEID